MKAAALKPAWGTQPHPFSASRLEEIRDQKNSFGKTELFFLFNFNDGTHIFPPIALRCFMTICATMPVSTPVATPEIIRIGR